jgi:hypothetical protein
MADQVKFGADATEYFDVVNRMSATANRLGPSIGLASGAETMLRSERIVSRSAANIVTSLFSADNAADALATTFLNLEHATVIGLGAAVAVAVGVSLYEAIKKATDEAFALNEEIRKTIALQSGPASYSSLDTLQAKLAAVREDQKKVQDEANKTFGSLGAAVGGIDWSAAGGTRPFQGLYGAVAAQNAARTQRSLELRQTELETLSKIAGKMAEAADLEDERMHVSQQTAALDKLDAEYIEKRAALVRGPGQNLEAVAQLDRMHSLQTEQLQYEQALERGKSDEMIKQNRFGRDRLASLIEEVRYTKAIYESTAGRSLEEQVTAQANYEKAVVSLREEVFQRQQALGVAQATTEASQLDLEGHHELASVVEDIATTEARYNQLIHEGNSALAEQVARQGELNALKKIQSAEQSLILEQAEEDIKTPQEKYAEYQRNVRLYEAARSRAYREGFAEPEAPRYGEVYHPYQPAFGQRAEELRQAETMAGMLDELAKAAQEARNKSANLDVLANKDFSGLAALGNLPFTGLAALNNLSITIK